MQTLSARLPIDLMAQQKQTQRETTPFGTWLKTTRNERGMTLEAVADRADTAQPVVTNLERGSRNPSRDMVARLARALMLSDADIEGSIYHRLLNAGLKAAGFLPEMETELDPDLQMIVENWDGMTPTGKRHMKSAAELALEMSRENSIGKRAE